MPIDYSENKITRLVKAVIISSKLATASILSQSNHNHSNALKCIADFTALQMKITKKQSISTAFQRLWTSFLVRNTMAVDLWDISDRYLQRPSFTIKSLLRLFSHHEGNQPHYSKCRGWERRKEASHYSHFTNTSLFYAIIVLSSYISF